MKLHICNIPKDDAYRIETTNKYYNKDNPKIFLERNGHQVAESGSGWYFVKGCRYIIPKEWVMEIDIDITNHEITEFVINKLEKLKGELK